MKGRKLVPWRIGCRVYGGTIFADKVPASRCWSLPKMHSRLPRRRFCQGRIRSAGQGPYVAVGTVAKDDDDCVVVSSWSTLVVAGSSRGEIVVMIINTTEVAITIRKRCSRCGCQCCCWRWDRIPCLYYWLLVFLVAYFLVFLCTVHDTQEVSLVILHIIISSEKKHYRLKSLFSHSSQFSLSILTIYLFTVTLIDVHHMKDMRLSGVGDGVVPSPNLINARTKDRPMWGKKGERNRGSVKGNQTSTITTWMHEGRNHYTKGLFRLGSKMTLAMMTTNSSWPSSYTILHTNTTVKFFTTTSTHNLLLLRHMSKN